MSTSPKAPIPTAAPRSAVVRPAVWVFHVALPMLGLWLLIARPQFDLRWEDHLVHLLLVGGGAAINVAMSLRIGSAAQRRSDARLYLVSLAFLSSAGFLMLHALSTPRVLIGAKTEGFVIATPVGLLIGAVFAAASAIDFTPAGSAAVMRRQRLLLGGIVLLMLAWAAGSLLGLPPLNSPLPPQESRASLVTLAASGTVLYAYAAIRYYLVYRRRPAVMLMGVMTAFVLLAEAMAAIVVSRDWHASWWEWHALMTVAFGYVAYSASVTYAREGSVTSLFNSISLAQTLRRVREEYSAALDALVSAMGRQAETGQEEDLAPLAVQLAQRFELSEGQVGVLEQAAAALAHELEQIRRLNALVEVGREARVILGEEELLERAVGIVADVFAHDALAVGLMSEGHLEFPPQLRRDATPPRGEDEHDAALAEAAARTLRPAHGTLADGSSVAMLPLTVKGHAAGVLRVRRATGEFAPRDYAVLESLSSQLSIALENARLYRQIDSLFHQYMSPDVATTLLADPTQARLGGAEVEITVLFADLRGFTAFSERSTPEAVVALLNQYLAFAVPLILEHGGTVTQFAGDAVMAVFNAPVRQPDHALRAARAALAMQTAIDSIVADRPDWPRFRIGLNTGPAVVGNIGSANLRDYTAIGDTVNLAARLETSGQPGQVVIGAMTLSRLGEMASVRSLGAIEVKGKAQPVEAFVLLGLADQG